MLNDLIFNKKLNQFIEANKCINTIFGAGSYILSTGYHPTSQTKPVSKDRELSALCKSCNLAKSKILGCLSYSFI